MNRAGGQRALLQEVLHGGLVGSDVEGEDFVGGEKALDPLDVAVG